MNFETICRVCLKEGPMKSIFTARKSDGERKISCSEMITNCATVTISKEDGLPSHICISCFKKLWSAYKFRQLCEKSFTCLLNCASKHSDGEVKIEKYEDLQVDDSDIYIKPEVNLSENSYLPNQIEMKNEDITASDSSFEEDLDNSHFVDENFTSPQSNEDSNYKEMKRHKKNGKKARKKKDKLNKKQEILEEMEDIESLGFPCSFCPKIFKRSCRLIAHQDFHMGIKRYFCELCKKSYRSEKDHLGMHKRGFKFKCEICGKFFNTKSKLSIHTETHNQNREKIVCGLNGCTKVFMTAGGLERHRTFHDGLKNIICHLCSKSFIDKYLLETHLRSHNNERRYPCSYCDKRFIQSSAKVAHERRHTNTKNYHCTLCEKSFVCSSVLKRHLLCHNKTNQESCRFCGKKFSRLDNRKRHESVMHGVTDNCDEKHLHFEKL